MTTTTTALREFFEREIPRLPSVYNWKIPKIPGFVEFGETGYEANLRLKDYLTQQWHSADENARFEWARVIVSDWGGVRRNKPETLREYVRRVGMPSPPTPLKGVASYSKIFAVALPSRHAIYDARVAACLNAVQINAGVSDGVAFHYVPGRNNVVGNRKKGVGFTEQPEFSRRRLLERGWSSFRGDTTYEHYLSTLGECLRDMPGHELRELEMALFANAEVECQHALSSHERTGAP